MHAGPQQQLRSVAVFDIIMQLLSFSVTCVSLAQSGHPTDTLLRKGREGDRVLTPSSRYLPGHHLGQQARRPPNIRAPAAPTCPL